MGSGRSGLTGMRTQGAKDDGYPHVTAPDGTEYTTRLNRDKQARHIKGTKGYRNEHSEQKGKSLFDGTLDEAQQCILDHAGTGTFIGNKEYVDCGKEIGIARSGTGSESTRFAVIHYSNTGAHIVPISSISYQSHIRKGNTRHDKRSE